MSYLPRPRVPDLKKSEVAAHLFWWIFDYEYPGLVSCNQNPTVEQRATLLKSIQSWEWWLALGWPEDEKDDEPDESS